MRIMNFKLRDDELIGCLSGNATLIKNKWKLVMLISSFYHFFRFWYTRHGMQREVAT